MFDLRVWSGEKLVSRCQSRDNEYQDSLYQIINIYIYLFIYVYTHISLNKPTKKEVDDMSRFVCTGHWG